ncbi:immunity protein YezG family protein [Sutcliffiella horikoshii]|uniref:immunity protein YezG family protein n=1 Tax=Sutcliffiella horikoshii TaxID=79883 RepID=UPI002958440C|nr:immunity protein YezG family protein [Sutcliffiella horikoshii]
MNINTEKIEHLYQSIANIVNDMIPEEWEKILLYAEIREGYKKCYFYYYSTSSSEYIYSLDIPDLFSMDDEEYDRLEDEMYDAFLQLQQEFKNQGQEEWTYLTYTLNHKGKVNIKYNYEDVSEISPVEKQNRWEKENLLG